MQTRGAREVVEELDLSGRAVLGVCHEVCCVYCYGYAVAGKLYSNSATDLWAAERSHFEHSGVGSLKSQEKEVWGSPLRPLGQQSMRRQLGNAREDLAVGCQPYEG